MAERVRIYIHPSAREEHQQRAVDLTYHRSMRGISEVCELRYPLEPIPDHVSTVMVVGGDGSTRAVGEKMLERDDPGVLVVTRGGSQNAFHSSLRDEGSTIAQTSIADADQLDIRPFRPGKANEHIFLYVAEHGQGVFRWTHRNEGLRKSRIPRDYRFYVSAIESGFEQSITGSSEPFVQAFVSSGNFNGVTISSQQELYSDKLTKVTVPPMNPLQLVHAAAATLADLAVRRRLPESVFQTQQATEFTLDDRGRNSQIGLGGDIFPLAPHDEIRVRRIEKTLKPVALVS